LVLLLFVFCPGALSQAVQGANDGGRGPVTLSLSFLPEAIVAPQLVPYDQTPTPPPQAPTQPKQPKKPYGWDIAIYPVLGWAPIFGASVTLPSSPGTPGPSGSTSRSFNGAYFGGARIEKRKWSADALFMWAALSGQRTNPLVKINLDIVFGQVFAGREVVRNLYLEGGVRRIALDINATVGSQSASRSPGVWDPLIGLTYRRQLGRKWRILIHGDGGGFGVGTDVDVTATARAEWQFAQHFGLTMGYGGLHFSESDTRANRTLTLSPTLSGPLFGFGIFF
jgi:hypothetical protein